MKKHLFGLRTSKFSQNPFSKWGWQRYLLATTGGIFLLGLVLFGGSQLYSQARRSFAQLSGEASFSAKLTASESASSSDSATKVLLFTIVMNQTKTMKTFLCYHYFLVMSLILMMLQKLITA